MHTEVTTQKGRRRASCQETQRWSHRRTEAHLRTSPQRERLCSDE